MTTAHRPTYNPTKGGNNQGGNKLYYPSLLYSSKDLPSNLTVKTRQGGQGTVKEVQKRDFKKELFERERRVKEGGRGNAYGLVSSLYGDVEENTFYLNDKESLNTSRVDITSDLLELEGPKKKQRLDSIAGLSEIANKSIIANENVFVQDKDLEFEDDSNEDKKERSEKSESLEGSDEEEEELLRELEKIKKERETENKKREMEKAEVVQLQTQEQILKGNPLLNNNDYSLKKKWYEDTVFKNQAKNEPKTKKRFINDTVRSDFHRKFLSKTMQ